jgi:hypothetical protein
MQAATKIASARRRICGNVERFPADSGMGETVQGSGSRALFWIATILAAGCIVLVAVNIVLSLVNQRAQAEVNERQHTIAESIQLKQLQDGIVRALATSANNNKDEQLRDLLVQLGFAVVNQAPGAAAPSGATSGSAPAPAAPESPATAAPAAGAKQ